MKAANFKELAEQIAIAAKQLQYLLGQIEFYIPQATVWAFGSRVNWSHRPESDLDLAVLCDKETAKKVLPKLNSIFDESDLPFKVQILDFNRLPANMQENINKNYLVLYEPQEKSLPDDWKETTLGKYISVKHGFAFKGEYFTDEENQNVLLTPGNFRIGGGFKDDKFKYYNGEFPSGYILKENDLIVTMTDLSKEGDTLGFPAKVPPSADKKYLHNQRIGLVEFLNDDLFKGYLFYLMCTKEYQRTIVNNASGSTVRHTSPTKIQEYEFILPPLLEQKAIAAILSSFDDKIELLRRQNKTLEAIAQTIFKEWFVNFTIKGQKLKIKKETGLPEGWRMGKLSDEFEIVMGQSPDGKSYNESANGMIFFQGRTDFQERFPTTRLYTTEPKRIAEKFDVLVSVRAPVGDINVAFDRCCIGRGLGAVRGKYKSYALYKIKSLEDAFRKFEDEGTVFGSIGKDSFANIEAIIPDSETVKAFEAIAGNIDKKIYNNYSQIQTLSKQRDLLLPKLMKGEIRVKSETD